MTNPFRRRHTRVIAVQCGLCRQWVKPRYLRVPALICRDCEATGRHQTWTPSPAHLQRAHRDAARGDTCRQQIAGVR